MNVNKGMTQKALNNAEFVSNNKSTNSTVLKEIQMELLNCDSFSMSVAFITEQGITMILQQLADLKDKGVTGRILTSTYQYFNDPKVYKKLMDIENIEVRIYSNEAHHTKGYIFEKGHRKNVIIGSSNLTASAMKLNREWNLKLNDVEDSLMINKIYSEFNEMWDSASLLTQDWIFDYEAIYSKKAKPSLEVRRDPKTAVIPNKMQSEAMRNLEALREAGESKAMLISATGTGKTYLSAFDVRNFNPKKALFVIHREQIARDAMRTFKKVMPNRTMGLLTGNEKNVDADIVFTTIQTLSKETVFTRFLRDAFDYIIIDEVHKAGAASYVRIVDYFNPKFLLGMSATPERNDDVNIYEMFDYNIAYEIRLNGALEEDMLTPFHYFGVSDATINGETIDESSQIFKLIDSQRVSMIIDKIEYYGFSGPRVKGLIFCGRNEEAAQISNEMNAQGLRTLALSGDNTMEEREDAIQRLTDETGDLDYILTVDIFNEGVDIPEINQIVMLRPTQSAIIFVQQMGRGLRKHRSKNYVVIIDFIGNYKNNYMIPLALSGDNSMSKNTLRKYIMEGNNLTPGVSTVEFDAISKERIYEAINKGRYASRANLRKEYEILKYRLGRTPKLMDFVGHNSIDPLILFKRPYRNYVAFKMIVDKEYVSKFEDYELEFLTYISSELSIGKRLIDLDMIETLVNDHAFSIENYVFKYGEDQTNSALSMLTFDFFVEVERDKYKSLRIISRENEMIHLDKRLIASLQKDTFRDEVEDVISFGKHRYYNKFEDHDSLGFVVGEQYTRKDVCWILNFESNQQGTLFGYKIDDYSKSIPLFVTYNKSDEIEDSIMYHDYFMNKHTFNWMSQNNRTLQSPEMIKLLDGYKNGYNIVLFVKRNDGEKTDFYYMGQVDIESYRDSFMEVKEKNVPVVEFILKLHQSVKDDLYYYLTES